MNLDDLRYLFIGTRARVYLLWGVLATAGFVATHFYQNKNINAVWTIMVAVALWFMYRVMPMKVVQMRRIFMAWLVPIGLGMLVSGAVFYISWLPAVQLIGYLGAFWLGVMAVGYALNALVDPPTGWYWFATILNAIACVLCFTVDALAQVQYLVAAVVTAWSMLNLWLFRADV
jgi:hypothetical protein